jgi:hypothetical protein
VSALGLGFVLFQKYILWSPALIFLLHAVLAVYFFAVLVSNQQYREDLIAKVERVASAVFFSYLFFLQLIYAPLARYFFGYLIEQKFFLSDILALLLFIFFVFLFFTSALVLNGFSRNGFLASWSVLNNPTTYFVLRNLFLAALLLSVFLYWQMPFIIITV